VDEAGGVVGLERAVEAAVVEDIGGRDRAVRIQTVAFDAIEGLVLDEGGDVRRSMARKGGFASAPQESVQDWQPTKPKQRIRMQDRLGMTASMARARARSTADSAQRPRRVLCIDSLIESSPSQIRK